jgi:hypothetical protein
VAIDEPLAVIGMIIAAVNVADPGICKLKPWDDLTELEQEPHPLVTMIAYWVVGVLDQHRSASLISDLGSFQIVSIDIGAKDLREESCNVVGERAQKVLDLGNAVT